MPSKWWWAKSEAAQERKQRGVDYGEHVYDLMALDRSTLMYVLDALERDDA